MASGVNFLRPQQVLSETRVIKGVSVVTMGEAEGHGVHLDEDFLDAVTRLGQAADVTGVKSRFGHPNMCNEALGTYIGRFHNFRRDGSQVRADLFISDTADSSPKGKLGTYVLEMAEKESDAFGTSIVFKPGRRYRRDEDGVKVYAPGSELDEGELSAGSEVEYSSIGDVEFVECFKLRATDVVDEAAANEGLFGNDIYADGELAAVVTEMLDTNPRILELARNHPEVVTEFMNRYEVNRATPRTTKETQMSEQASGEAPQPNTPAPEASAPEPATPETPETQPELNAQDGNDELSEYRRSVTEFGVEATETAWNEGTGYAGAQAIALNALREENEALAKKLSAKDNKSEGAEPTALGEGTGKPGTIFKGHRK